MFRGLLCFNYNIDNQSPLNHGGQRGRRRRAESQGPSPAVTAGANVHARNPEIAVRVVDP